MYYSLFDKDTLDALFHSILLGPADGILLGGGELWKGKLLAGLNWHSHLASIYKQ